MKSFNQHINEGTWALPDTQKKYDKLMKLMQRKIPAGKATKILYNFAGDDALFDAIGEKEKEDKIKSGETKCNIDSPHECEGCGA